MKATATKKPKKENKINERALQTETDKFTYEEAMQIWRQNEKAYVKMAGVNIKEA